MESGSNLIVTLRALNLTYFDLPNIIWEDDIFYGTFISFLFSSMKIS